MAGVLSFFSQENAAFQLQDVDTLRSWILLVQTVMENRLLREVQNVASVIQKLAQTLGQNPTPQDLVDMMRDYLCGPHVALCVLMFYGPQREDHPTGPFDYLEVQGSWSRTMGEAAGMGMRLYLDQYAPFMRLLERRQVLHIGSLDLVERRIDPLIRGFLRSERIQSILCIHLRTNGRELGGIFIGSDRPHHFDTQERRNFQAVAEFISVAAMADVLQQQQDFIQRARADLLDAVSDGVMMVLPNDGKSQAGKARAYVLTVNQGFTRMFNFSQDRARGLTMAQVVARMQIPQDVGQRLYEAWMSISIRDPAVQNGEFNMILPEGYPASIEWHSAPVYHENRVMGRMYIFHDIAPSRTAASLRANFIARVSHELRTPLTSIRGFAEFILDEMGDDLPDLAREYTQIILNSARHLNELFSDVIEISRADIGELHLQITTVHLPDLIIDVTAQVNLEAKARGQTIIMELDDDLPSFQIDANRIIQVLANLLSNAIHYAPPDTRIRVCTDLLTDASQLPASAPPDVVLPCVLITVTDEGSGLSADEAERIFLPFYRGKEARGGQIEGSGLGLTISRSIIELHRGKIWAEPRRRGRKGARFLFTLPMSEG